MKVNIIEVPAPLFSEYTMFAKVDKENLTETKIVRVIPSHITKTRISTSIQIGQSRSGINFEVDSIKTYKSEEYNMFTYKVDTKYYFVKSKKQGIEVYKKYVEKVVEDALINYIGIDLDEVTVELETDRF